MDEKTPGAEPSPAPIEVPQEPAAYAEWRHTGKLPEAKAAPAEKKTPKAEAAATSNESENDAPASEAGTTKQEKKPRSTAETRLNELLADLKTAGLSPAELKTFKRQAQKAETEQPKIPEQTAKPAADPKAPERPKVDDFKTWEEYEAARDKYFEDLADYKARQAVESDRARQRAEAADREMQAKLAEAKTRYGEDADTAIVASAQAVFGDREVSPGVKAVLNDSPVLVDLMYALGSKSDEFQAFLNEARTNPAAAIRRAVLVEKLVQDELAKSSPATGESQVRDESGKFQKTTPAKKITEAPPPPREASGRSAAPPDESESAFSANDFARFRAAENRKDIARRKGN